jgi:hypothetical protein
MPAGNSPSSADPWAGAAPSPFTASGGRPQADEVAADETAADKIAAEEFGAEESDPPMDVKR